MTVPVQRRNVGTVLQNHDERILALERERLEVFGFGYEMQRELLEAADVVNLNGSSSTTFDNTYYRGFYVDIGGNGNETMFALRLGPQGAMYHVQFVVHRGPSCGEFRFEWAQVPADAANAGDDWPPSAGSSGATVLTTEGLLLFPDDPAYNWVVFGDGNEQDLYNATVSKNSIGNGSPSSRYQQIRIMGDYGDVLSADVSSGGMTTFGSNGGPGIYLLKVVCTGKNPSSSSFDLPFSSLVVIREFADNFSV